jgi:transcription initiation factor TFIIA large subunit
MSSRGRYGDANASLEPSIYRAIIDDVITAIKPDFDEFGVSEDILAALQNVSKALGITQRPLSGINAVQKWETKVIASHVADFESASANQQPSVPSRHYVPQQPMIPHHYQHPYTPLPGPGQTIVKTEPMDSRYLPNPPPGMAYALPTLAGPQIPGRPPTTQPPVSTYSPQPPQVC